MSNTPNVQIDRLEMIRAAVEKANKERLDDEHYNIVTSLKFD